MPKCCRCCAEVAACGPQRSGHVAPLPRCRSACWALRCFARRFELRLPRCEVLRGWAVEDGQRYALLTASQGHHRGGVAMVRAQHAQQPLIRFRCPGRHLRGRDLATGSGGTACASGAAVHPPLPELHWVQRTQHRRRCGEPALLLGRAGVAAAQRRRFARPQVVEQLHNFLDCGPELCGCAGQLSGAEVRPLWRSGAHRAPHGAQVALVDLGAPFCVPHGRFPSFPAKRLSYDHSGWCYGYA